MALSLADAVVDTRTIYVDVRTKGEVASPPTFPKPFLHIPVSVADASSVSERASELPTDKATPIVVFCAVGARSAAAQEALERMGYSMVLNGISVATVTAATVTAALAAGSLPPPVSSSGKDTTFEPPPPPLPSGERAPANLGTCSLMAELAGHAGTVWCVAWSPDGKLLASCGSDKTIRIWGPSRGSGGSSGSSNASNVKYECVATLDEGQARTVRSLAWSPCGNYLASVSFDATTAVWERQKPEEDEAPGSGMSWELAVQLEGHENEVKSVCWSRDGGLLATCGRDKSVWVWEVADLAGSDYECLAVLHDHTQDVKQVKFHPRGLGASGQGVLVSCSYDDTVRVWAEDGDDWSSVQCLIAHSSTVWGVAFGPPPRLTSSNEEEGSSSSSSTASTEAMVTCSDDQSIILWKQSGNKGHSGAAGWVPTQQLPLAHHRAVFTLDWAQHHCNAPLASGGADNALRIWRWADSSTTKAANDQQELVLDVEVLHAHEGDVNGVAWQTNTTSSSSSQPLLATAGDDGLVKLWAYA